MGDYDWIPAAVQAGGAMLGSQQQGKYADQALNLQREAYRKALELIGNGSALSYEPAMASGLGGSAMAGTRPDAGAVMAQRDALSQLQEAAREGYNAVDKAAINGMLGEVGQQERGSREAAMSRLDPGSGASIAARLSAQQGSANRANQQGLTIAAASRKKALDALSGYGNLATSMRGQSFGEDAKRAEAMDAISRFNAETSRFNAGAQNAANASGVANRLGAAGVLRGATGDLAGGLNARGQMAFNQAAGASGMAGNALGAALEDDEEKKK